MRINIERSTFVEINLSNLLNVAENLIQRVEFIDHISFFTHKHVVDKMHIDKTRTMSRASWKQNDAREGEISD